MEKDNLYPSGIISGYYGNQTMQAVKQFQQKYGLEINGNFDLVTLNKFNQVYGGGDRQYYLNLIPTIIPTKPPINQSVISQIIDGNQEWGKAKQISEYSWIMKVGLDDRMATAKEIFEALNIYRQTNGSGALTWDEGLALYALQRAQDFSNLGRLDSHEGFKNYVNNIDNLKKLNFWSVGENSSYGYKLHGVHLIEWVYAGDKPHNDNQLNPKWTHIGIGVDGNQTDLIFGGNKM
ncbi:MAG: hypothetical protein ACD_12C00075G0001 [uncultured bacterium]|nr:MAG: hypothetical protein ACD_12C00075G0001 [uncultured bacterium]